MGVFDSTPDHEHWPENEVHGNTSGGPGNVGDENNGRYRYTYYPSGPTAAAPTPIQAPAPVYHQAPVTSYPMQYYYGQNQWQAGPMWQGQVGMAQSAGSIIPGYYQVPAQEPPKPTMSNPYTWIGRSQAEVDEDNMKIAKAEGAYDKREVVPIGLKNDQVVWVVEADGEYTLRTFASVKELKGSWKQDPRFESAWFFVRENAD